MPCHCALNGRFSFVCPLGINPMTTSELKAFPPVDDAVAYIKQIDWVEVRRRAHKGLNNCGVVIAVVGEKVHDFGAWIAQV